MSQENRSCEVKLAAAEKTIEVLMERTEHAIDTAGSLHNLFESNLLLKKKISQHLRYEEQLTKFNRALEQQVALRTQELEDANRELASMNARLKELVRRDGLTGLYNHTAMSEIIKQKVEEANRYQLPLSIVMLDIDHFKKVNDTFGHQFGDHVLRQVADVLQEGIRSVDYASRFGGEEFILLLSNTNEVGAIVTAERIRTGVAKLSWDEKSFAVSVSAGIASLGDENVDAFIAKADKYLYKAKELGRNRVVSSY